MERVQMSEFEKKAFEIARSAHWGQKDKQGVDYFLHVQRVAQRGKNENERIAGFLHDTPEDTDITVEHLADVGFPKEVIDTIEALTKKEDETYDEYLGRVKENELARTVKLYDLEDNMDPERQAKLDKETSEILMKKYRYARDFLLSPLPK